MSRASDSGRARTDPSRFPNPWRGLWFAIVTVTTGGCGDTFPTSPGGRLVVAFLMVVAIGFLGLPTASIPGHFVNQDAADKHREAIDKQDAILAEPAGCTSGSTASRRAT
jgi:hypothetical protein